MILHPNQLIIFSLSFFFTFSMEQIKIQEKEEEEELTLDFPPFLKIYKDGRIIRLLGTEIVPPSQNPDPKTGVSSKDVLIDPQTCVSARLYLPKITTNSSKKLPLLIYFHGGAFCIETPFSPTYHNYLNTLVSQSNVVAISIDYRKAPEYPVPIAYEDSWVSLKRVLSHSNGGGSESWINTHVDFDRVFLAGDSAGANIAHNMAIRAGTTSERSLLNGVKIFGIALIQPYFWGVEPIGSEVNVKEEIDNMWINVYPSISGFDEPLINPGNDPNLSKLGCEKVLVVVAEKDKFRERGWLYYEKLGKSGWNGGLEIMETEGEEHVFHLFNPSCEKAVDLMKRVVSFINQEI